MENCSEATKKLLADCSADEKRAIRQWLSVVAPHPLETEWGVDADTILSAIERSSDLTKRGVRGIIAEAVFEKLVLPKLARPGWKASIAPHGLPYDALLTAKERKARIQIKLQRLENGQPKIFHPKHYPAGSYFVVEVQKTRGGKKKAKRSSTGKGAGQEREESAREETRPYRFADFDILAVSLHPSTKNWADFRYTVASWLLPRAGEKKDQIEIFQPVANTPNDGWTDDLATCLGWFESGEQRSILAKPLHLPKKAKPKTEMNKLSDRRKQDAAPKASRRTTR